MLVYFCKYTLHFIKNKFFLIKKGALIFYAPFSFNKTAYIYFF